MTYYLLENPPKSRQFYTSRNTSPTWAVGVHTSEGSTGPGSARALAAFIARRSDPGSYAAIVDSEETVYLVPPDFTTFSVASAGYNSRTWHICLAGRSADLSPNDSNTQAMITRAGSAIRELWQSLGIDVNAAAQWVGTDALNRVGLFCHGTVQPADRSDAWSRHPDRATFDQQLVNAIRTATPTPGPISTKDTDMFHMVNTDKRDEFIALTDGGQVVSCWSGTPGGPIGPWMELKPGIAGSNLVAEYAADGRLCVTLAAMGELWGSWQAAPSTGPWCDWFRVNDLRALVA